MRQLISPICKLIAFKQNQTQLESKKYFKSFDLLNQTVLYCIPLNQYLNIHLFIRIF